MKALVLGAYGMLGHRVFLELSRRAEVLGTCRHIEDKGMHAALLPPERLVPGVDAESFESVSEAISRADPDVVVNCIGIVKQLKEAQDPVKSIRVNALFPHLLAAECGERGVRLLHFSTDCVFSGRRGMYTEDDIPDPVDLYGRTKLVGELHGKGCITIRTSLIGRELGSANGLVEWFLANRRGRVKGYKNAIFSGFTTAEMARVVWMILSAHQGLSGVWHVASKPISKYDLLRLLNDRMSLGTDIEEVELPRLDRSLDGGRFSRETGYSPPAWEAMVEEMASEADLYRDASSREG